MPDPVYPRMTSERLASLAGRPRPAPAQITDPDPAANWWGVVFAVSALLGAAAIVVLVVLASARPAAGQTVGPPVYGPTTTLRAVS